MTLKFAKDTRAVRKFGGYRSFIEKVADIYDNVDERPDWEAPQGDIEALVNHSNWLVRCPNPDCSEVTMVDQGELYWCPNCGSADNDFAPRTVIFPSHIKTITTLLAKRPRQNRNWEPGETLAQLKRENKERGL